jgi:hypothetical protein
VIHDSGGPSEDDMVKEPESVDGVDVDAWLNSSLSRPSASACATSPDTLPEMWPSPFGGIREGEKKIDLEKSSLKYSAFNSFSTLVYSRRIRPFSARCVTLNSYTKQHQVTGAKINFLDVKLLLLVPLPWTPDGRTNGRGKRVNSPSLVTR